MKARYVLRNGQWYLLAGGQMIPIVKWDGLIKKLRKGGL